MKFLCGNCKAKYQIADEKIAGRTLRMKCRRCSHDIIIKGEQAAQKVAASKGRAAAGGARSAASAGRPSALSADFRRNVSARPEPPPPRAPVAQWHVAINDVPVGPIKSEEMGRKVGTGAVSGESLVWREGFDDWRPLKEVPELAALLRQPPPAPSPRASVGRGIGRSASRPRIRPSVAPPRPESSRPAPMSNVVPIGGRIGPSATGFDQFEATRVSEPLFPDSVGPVSPKPPPSADPFGPMTPAPSANALLGTPSPFSAPPTAPAPEPTRPADALGDSDGGGVEAAVGSGVALGTGDSSVYPMPIRQGLPIGAWIGILGAMAFGVTLALVVSMRFLFPSEPVANNDASATEGTGDNVDLVIPEGPETEHAEDEPMAEPAEDDPEQTEGRRPRNPTRQGDRPRQPVVSSMMTRQLSAAERALIERMGMESGGSTPSAIQVSMRAGIGEGSGTGRLNAQQLSSVVSRNRPSLTRCYETAIRGSRNAPSARINVTVTVGRSGTVTRVSAAGGSIPGLTNCVEQSVRRWRFPSSGQSVETSFPVVFSPQG